MKVFKKIIPYLIAVPLLGLIAVSCQKMDRPSFGDYPQDPAAPPLQVLDAKSYWAFEGNVRDTGEWKLKTRRKNVSFVPGVTAVPDQVGGQAAQIGDKGYVMVTNAPDALKNPGSFSVAFWMKGAKGPIAGGAQGIFAVGNSTQFWGNLEMFLENYNDANDPNAVFMKIHMLNANAAGGGDLFIQGDEVKIKDVLGKWTHIALVYDGATSKISLYKDGAVTALDGHELGGGSYGNLKWDNLTGLAIGTFAFQTSPTLASHGSEGWAKSFNGALDQFRIYTKALTAAEVKNLFDNKL